MIIGENFVWLHFPKCAGTFTEQLLRQCANNEDKDIVFDAIDTKNVIWHQSIIQREASQNIDLSNKLIVCNFRKLPYWLLSRINYEKERSGIITSKEMALKGQFLNRNRETLHADDLVSKFTSREVSYWIRTENLYDDFINIFSKLINFKQIPKKEDFHKKVNTSSSNQPLDYTFSKEELYALYKNCPKWSNLEMKLYGQLITNTRQF